MKKLAKKQVGGGASKMQEQNKGSIKTQEDIFQKQTQQRIKVKPKPVPKSFDKTSNPPSRNLAKKGGTTKSKKK